MLVKGGGDALELELKIIDDGKSFFAISRMSLGHMNGNTIFSVFLKL